MRRNHIPGQPLCISRRYGPRIGLDIDGVIRDVEGNIRKIIKQKWPKAELIDTTKWIYQGRYKNVPKNIEKILFHDYAVEIFFKSFPYPGAIKFTKKLHKLANKYNGRLVYVTHQGNASANATLLWLAKYDFLIRELQIVPLEESKTTAECDILIDDHTTNLCEQRNKYGGAICRKQPWNFDWGGQRLETFSQLYKSVKKLLKNIEEKRKHED